MKTSVNPLWRSRLSNYFNELKYGLHVIVRPFDGFWNLTREKRGSLAAANTFILLTLLTKIIKLSFTNFQFLIVHLEQTSLFMECLAIYLPLFIYVCANWCFTTLFEGKGTFRDVYIGMGYCLIPYSLLQLPMVVISNVITLPEGAFYYVIASISLIWCGFLFLVAMMQIHDYTLGKTLAFTIISLLGMLIIIFLLLLFFSMLSDAASFVSSLYKETIYRMY